LHLDIDDAGGRVDGECNKSHVAADARGSRWLMGSTHRCLGGRGRPHVGSLMFVTGHKGER
jgi:hypothetical protein